MTQSQRGVYKTVVCLLALVALIIGLYVAQQVYGNQKQTLLYGTRLDKPREVVPFSLTGTDNQPFTNASLQGQWTMMFFGFTHCGSICPTTMAELGQMYRLLAQKNAPMMPHVVMVSLDPERDTLTRLGQYVKAFDTHFYGARGESSMIKRLTQDLGVAYTHVVRNTTDEAVKADDIEHSGAVMLFDPNGDLVAFFTGPHHAKELASDFLLFV